MYLKSGKTESMPLLASKPNVHHVCSLYIGNRVIRYTRREGGPGTMGGFGGGWNVCFGFESSSWTNLLLLRSALFNVFFFSVRVGLQSEYDNEAKARAA